jgi:hypothetical protein
MCSAIDRTSNRRYGHRAWRGEPSRLPGDADLALVLAVEATEDANGRKLSHRAANTAG